MPVGISLVIRTGVQEVRVTIRLGMLIMFNVSNLFLIDLDQRFPFLAFF